MKNLIISTQSPLEMDNLGQTGDVDYARNIAAEVQKLTSARVQYCNSNTKAVLNEQLQDDPQNTVLHLMVNAPRTGFALDLPYLEQVKNKGCRIIMTAVEFAKHEVREYKKQTLDYLHYAEHIIFLDEEDKSSALNFAKKIMPGLVERINQAQVISVPPTISPQFITREKTGSNIICFGMVRAGKGYAYVTHLAEIMKNSDNPYLNDKQIYIVGTVQAHKTSKEGTAYDAELYKLLCKLYPQYQHEFYNKTPDELVALYENIKNQDCALPIKLFLNVPEDSLPALFRECEYAIYSAYRGITLRNSSISTELGYGCIIYSFEGDITPSCLNEEGEYRNAMVIFNDNDYFEFPKNIAKNLIVREQDKAVSSSEKRPSLNDKTRAMALTLLEHEIALSGVAARHQSVYQSLFQTPESEKVSQPGTMGLFHKAADEDTPTGMSMQP